VANKKSSEAKVTRIKASDSRPSKKEVATKPARTKAAKSAPQPSKKSPAVLRPFIAMGRYFKGAWAELREVRWPTRRATWGLTLAVIIFSVIIGVLILLLDALFKFIFEQILA